MGAWLLYGLTGCKSADGHITLGARSLLFVLLDYLTFLLPGPSSCVLHLTFLLFLRGSWLDTVLLVLHLRSSEQAAVSPSCLF